MTTSTAATMLDKVRALERNIELLKMELFWDIKRNADRAKILKEAFGVLGKNFTSGIGYENKIRKEWNKNLRFS